ncbi:hypothetical protein ACNS7O_17485 (plasmid) [Haloferacaceae archaeon DSL9]
MNDPLFAGVLVLVGCMLVILWEAIRRRNTAAVVNTLASVAATILPPALEVSLRAGFDRTVTFGPELPLWIAAAGCLHSFGMLGPYDSVRWWDSLTHTVSAALVTALVFAGIIVVDQQSSVVAFSALQIAALAVSFILAAGIFWELVEVAARDVGERYDVEPVLVRYGHLDTVLDLAFDLVGALVVVVADVRLFVPIAEQSPSATATILLWAAAVVVVGSALIAVAVRRGRD